MSRFREYEELKVQYAKLQNRVTFLLFLGMGIGAVVGFYLYEGTKNILFLFVAIMVGTILSAPAQIRLGNLRARVKAMENSNFQESYIQQNIGTASNPTQGYAKEKPNKLDSLEAELEKLKSMKDKGLIDDEEYKSMRSKLLK